MTVLLLYCDILWINRFESWNGLIFSLSMKNVLGFLFLGDLIVTCSSDHSRNRQAGKLIGAGKTVEEAKQEVGMTIESIDNIDVAYELSKKYNIEMPIVNAVYDVLYKGLDPKEAVTMLMTRDKKAEISE